MSDDQPAGEVPDFDADDEAIIDSVWDRIAAEDAARRPPPGPKPGDDAATGSPP